MQRRLIERCRNDINFYIDTFVYQYNPRKKKGSSPVGPFVLWGFQEKAVAEILWAIQNDEDLLIVKSREMGASWLCLIIMDWLWHFHDWQKFLCISRSEQAVDSADPDCLFWKLDFIHDHLPHWLKPDCTRSKLFFGNNSTHSTITGQASTGRAGVGGRATAMFIDEFSQIKEDFEVLHRTSDTTGCRIFNGTHRGVGTAFHQLSERVDMKKLTMHWTDHPDKNKGSYRYDDASNKVIVLDKTYSFPADFQFVREDLPSGGPFPGIRSPWYDKQVKRKGDLRAVAMDLDIDAGGSVSQFFNPLTIKNLLATDAIKPYWEGDISFDRDTGRPLGLVQVKGGPLLLWSIPNSSGNVATGPYCMGADISTGVGASNSVLSIIDAVKGEKVGEFATASMKPEDFAMACMALGWTFKDDYGVPAYFIWEHAGPGQLFGERIVESKYPHCWYRDAMSANFFGQGRNQSQVGWVPSIQSKRTLLDEYRAALEKRQLVNRSEYALRECLSYKYTHDGGVEHPSDSKHPDPTGARVNHGDRVIADSLAWKLVKKLNRMDPVKPAVESMPVGSLGWRRKLHENISDDNGWEET